MLKLYILVLLSVYFVLVSEIDGSHLSEKGTSDTETMLKVKSARACVLCGDVELSQVVSFSLEFLCDTSFIL